MENIKAVIFDFDNTLADRTDASYKTYTYFLDNYAPQYRKGSIEYEAFLQDLMIWDLFGNYDKEFTTYNLKKKYNMDLPFRFGDWWRANQFQFEELFPDTMETLEYLKAKGYKMAVITNGEGSSQRAKVMRTGLDKIMDYLMVCGEHGMRKPNRDCFDYTCQQLGVSNEEAVYVGDIFSNDVLGAYKAGLTPIWIWPDGRRENQAGVIQITKISELKKYL